MRYQVPQFIEVEDKIFESISLRQFIYLAGGAAISYMLFRFLPSIIFSFIPILAIMGFSLALAFLKINNKPFIFIVEAAFKYYTSTKLFIWKKVPNKKSENPVQEAKEYAGIMVPKISDSKLKDLIWSLDIKESMYNNQNQK